MIVLALLYITVIVLWCCLIWLLQGYFSIITRLHQIKNKESADLKNRLEDQRNRQQTSIQINLIVNTLVQERLQDMEQKLTVGKEESLVSSEIDTLTKSLKDVLKADLNLLKAGVK